jgi:hypothetical protein
LPTASTDNEGGIVYDETTSRITYSDGAAWIGLQPYDAAVASLAALSIVQGDILYGSGTDALSRLAKDTNATRYLSNTGTSNNPAWAQVNLANGVTGDLPFANLAQGTALSVLGVTGNSTADNASIVAGSDGDVLRRSGTAVGFGTVATAGIADDAVTFAKFQNIATAKVLGRATASTGDVEELSTTGTGNVVLATTPTLSGNVGIGGAAASRLDVMGANAGTTGLFRVGIAAVSNGFTITTTAGNVMTYTFLSGAGANILVMTAALASFSVAVKTLSTTVGSLPAAGTAGSGARAFVTDATATTFLSTVAGSGANKVPVVSDGTNWLIG